MILTPRLLIRPFQPEDTPAAFEYLSNPTIYRFEPGAPLTLEETTHLITERAKHTDFWAVLHRATDKLVGHLYFSPNEPKELLTWELGYIFNPAHQNQGYATESATALLRHGFEHFGIHRLVAHCNPENIASWRVLEKIGMTREGHLRQNIFFHRDANGNPLWNDSYTYAILKKDLFPQE